MKRSMGLRDHAVFLTAGSSALRGGSKAQCVVQAAPSSIHRRSRSICWAESCFPDLLGGIFNSGSSLSRRKTRSLSSGLPATIAAPPDLSLANAPSLVSSRRPALRARSSGPWHAKQLSERMERTSRAKLIGRLFVFAPSGPGPSAPLTMGVPGQKHPITAIKRPVGKAAVIRRQQAMYSLLIVPSRRLDEPRTAVRRH